MGIWKEGKGSGRGAECTAAGTAALRLGCRFFCRLLEQLGIDRRIELQRRVFRGTRVLAVLLVVAQKRKSQSVHRLPVVQVSLALHRLTLAEGAVSFFQNVPALPVDKPADGGACGIYIDNAGLDVADFLGSRRSGK